MHLRPPGVFLTLTLRWASSGFHPVMMRSSLLTVLHLWYTGTSSPRCVAQRMNGSTISSCIPLDSIRIPHGPNLAARSMPSVTIERIPGELGSRPPGLLLSMSKSKYAVILLMSTASIAHEESSPVLLSEPLLGSSAMTLRNVLQFSGHSSKNIPSKNSPGHPHPLLLTDQLPFSSRALSILGSACRLARYPGSASISLGLSVNFAPMNVTLIGVVPCSCWSAAGSSPHTMSSFLRTIHRITPDLSGIGKPVVWSIHHAMKSASHPGCGLAVARMYGLTPHVERLRDSRYQNCCSSKDSSWSNPIRAICAPRQLSTSFAYCMCPNCTLAPDGNFHDSSVPFGLASISGYKFIDSGHSPPGCVTSGYVLLNMTAEYPLLSMCLAASMSKANVLPPPALPPYRHMSALHARNLSCGPPCGRMASAGVRWCLSRCFGAMVSTASSAPLS